MLAKNAGYRYGAHQTDCTPFFFVFLIRHCASLFFITTCRNKPGGMEERSMEDRRMVVKDGNTKRPATSDANARKFNNTRLLNEVQGQNGSGTKF
jgi:hypothetical protein